MKPSPARSSTTLVLIIILSLLLSACGGGNLPKNVPTNTPEPAEEETNLEPAQEGGGVAGVDQPTATLVATKLPTRTPRPSPTPTALPTETLAPTETTLPSTPTTTSTPELPVTGGTAIPQVAVQVSAWHSGTFTELAFTGQRRVWEARLSADGSKLFAATSAGVEVYDAANGILLATLPPIASGEFPVAGTYHKVQPARDGSSVVVFTREAIQGWSVDGQMTWSMPYPEVKGETGRKYSSLQADISPDLSKLAFSTLQKFEVWDTASNTQLFKDWGTHPRFSPDNAMVAVRFNGSLWLYNPTDWSKRVSVGMREGWEMAFSPDSQRVAVILVNQVLIFQLADGKLVQFFNAERGRPSSILVFSPDGSLVGWAGRETPDTPLYVYKVADGKLAYTLRRTTSIYDGWQREFTRLNDDGTATVNELGENLQKSGAQPTLPPGYVNCLVNFGVDSACAGSLSHTYFDQQGMPYIISQKALGQPYEVHTGLQGEGTFLGSLDIPNDTLYDAAALSPDGKFFFLNTRPDDKTSNLTSADAELWSLEGGWQVKRWQGRFETVAFSPDGRYAAFFIARYSGTRMIGITLVVYDLAEFQVVYTKDPGARTGNAPTGLTFLPQGLLAYGVEMNKDGKPTVDIRLVDTVKWADRRQINIPDAGLAASQPVNGLPALAVSPDGKLLAAALGDNRVRIFDLASGIELYTFVPHTSQTTAITFSADGAWLGTYSAMDGFARVWGVIP